MGIELGLELGSPISCVDEHQKNRITISETWDLNRRSDFPKSSTTKIWIRESNIKLCRWESVSVDSTTEIKGQNLNRLVVCTHSNIRPQANSLRTLALSAHRKNDLKWHTRTFHQRTLQEQIWQSREMMSTSLPKGVNLEVHFQQENFLNTGFLNVLRVELLK